MPKIDITMNSIYDSGKKLNLVAIVEQTIDNSLSIRGIKFEKAGEAPEEVRVVLPKREDNAILSMFDNEFPSQLNMEAYYSYCSELGIDMSIADPIENTQVNPKNLDVLVTKINENPDSTMKAMANVTIDNCFSVNRVEIRDVDGVLDVQMPQRKTVDGFKEICSLASESYEKLFKDCVLDAYILRLEQVQATEIEVSIPELGERCDSFDEVNQDDLDEIGQDSEDELHEQEENEQEIDSGMTMGGMNDGN